ncbi:MAG TPA: nicotinate-nucleotide adenylyltransferase [Candidatus Limnocylindrales bacterium]
MTGPDWVAPGDRRVGILGGTFDPIHYGHLVIAEQVREALELDRVLFVPAGTPPHKQDDDITAATDRAAMVELAIAGNPDFTICRIELERDGPSYTVDTVEELVDEASRRGVARDFFFILSSEALAALNTWHEPVRLMSLCRLVVVPRPGAPLPDTAWLESHLPAVARADRVVRVQTVPLAHSASDVRNRAAAGRSIRYLVPPAVEAYIHQHRLYRSDHARRTA